MTLSQTVDVFAVFGFCVSTTLKVFDGVITAEFCVHPVWVPGAAE